MNIRLKDFHSSFRLIRGSHRLNKATFDEIKALKPALKQDGATESLLTSRHYLVFEIDNYLQLCIDYKCNC